jgi:hypothetical protein
MYFLFKKYFYFFGGENKDTKTKLNKLIQKKVGLNKKTN